MVGTQKSVAIIKGALCLLTQPLLAAFCLWDSNHINRGRFFMAKNTNLHAANKNKNDEFYTGYDDIKNELLHYARHFKGKTIYCNCDDHNGIGLGTPKSNFLKYLADNFLAFGLKKVIATHYEKDKKSTKYILLKDNTGDGVICMEDILEMPLEGDGDFRSAECIALLKQADIVITNPPFSLFREYVAQLMAYKKKFLIIGNKNAISYKDIFPFISNNKLWTGATPFGKDLLFDLPRWFAEQVMKDKKEGSGYKIVHGTIKGRSQSVWFTNLDHKKRHEVLDTGKKYYGNETQYPKYDNYDAINVNKTADIPMDYDGVMGVPITFLDKYNPEQFEIIDLNPHFFLVVKKGLPKPDQLHITGQKDPFARILIRKKKGK
jgi:hypothetical protein